MLVSLPCLSAVKPVFHAAGGMTLKAELDELVRQQLERQTGKSDFLDTCSSAHKRAVEKQCDKVINPCRADSGAILRPGRKQGQKIKRPITSLSYCLAT